MTFDKAHEGDTARWCNRTFGLRPPEEWSEPVTVIAVADTYYGQEVTISTGETLTSGLHHMAIVKCAARAGA